MPTRTPYPIFEQLNSPGSRAHTTALMLVILAGFLLRAFGYISGEGYHYFSISDEISAFNKALEFVAGQEHAQYIGQPTFSGGFAPGPVWTLFCVALLSLTGFNVDAALFITVLISTVSIYLVYKLACHFMQPNLALFATLLYATAPWTIYYSVGIWNPFPLAIIGTSLYLLLWRVIRNENSSSIFWVCVIAAAIPQFHMIGIFYLPALLAILILSPVRLNRRWLSAGIVAGIALYVPYILGDMSHDWENSRKILSGSGAFSFSVLKIVTAPVTVMTNLPGRWISDNFNDFISFGNRWFGSYIVLLSLNILSIIFAIWAFFSFFFSFIARLKSTWKQPKMLLCDEPQIAFIGILLFIPPALFLLTGHNYSTRYAIISFPLLFLLPALLLRKRPRLIYGKVIRYTFSIVFVTNIYLTVSFNLHLKSEIEDELVLVSSFKKMESVRKSVQQHAGPDFRVVIDPIDYITETTDKAQKAGRSLALYNNVYQKLLREPKEAENIKSYRLVNTQKRPITQNDVVAYQGKGFAVIRKYD